MPDKVATPFRCPPACGAAWVPGFLQRKVVLESLGEPLEESLGKQRQDWNAALRKQAERDFLHEQTNENFHRMHALAIEAGSIATGRRPKVASS